jgi:hypothetical protein
VRLGIQQLLCDLGGSPGVTSDLSLSRRADQVRRHLGDDARVGFPLRRATVRHQHVTLEAPAGLREHRREALGETRVAEEEQAVGEARRSLDAVGLFGQLCRGHVVGHVLDQQVVGVVAKRPLAREDRGSEPKGLRPRAGHVGAGHEVERAVEVVHDVSSRRAG